MAARGPKSDKLWSDAVRVAAMREAEDDEGKIRKRLNIIADNLCKLAMAGDMQAIKEVGDRIDGKPAQALQHSNPDGSPLTFVIRDMTKDA
jgi:molecular chaperone GrpE (heat shock protein)